MAAGYYSLAAHSQPGRGAVEFPDFAVDKNYIIDLLTSVIAIHPWYNFIEQR